MEIVQVVAAVASEEMGQLISPHSAVRTLFPKSSECIELDDSPIISGQESPSLLQKTEKRRCRSATRGVPRRGQQREMSESAAWKVIKCLKFWNPDLPVEAAFQNVGLGGFQPNVVPGLSQSPGTSGIRSRSPSIIGRSPSPHLCSPVGSPERRGLTPYCEPQDHVFQPLFERISKNNVAGQGRRKVLLPTPSPTKGRTKQVVNRIDVNKPIVNKPFNKPDEKNPNVHKPNEKNPNVNKPNEKNPNVNKPNEKNPNVNKPNGKQPPKKKGKTVGVRSHVAACIIHPPIKNP